MKVFFKICTFARKRGTKHSEKGSLPATRLSVVIALLACASLARGASISGSVHDILTGEALPGITIAAANIDSVPRDSFPGDPADTFYYETVTDPDGGYMFSELPPGRYSVYERVLRSEYPEIIDVYGDVDHAGINMELVSPGRDTFSVSGEVRLLEYYGYPGYGEVTVFSPRGQIIGHTFLIPDDSIPYNPSDTVPPYFQPYIIGNLPPVFCSMYAFVYDYLPQYYDHAYAADTIAVPVKPGADSVNFDMELGDDDSLWGGGITGTIRGGHGLLSYASVYARKGTRLVKGTISDFDGSYYIYGLDPGTYTIYATRPGYYTKVYSNTITIADQWVDGIDISLVPVYDAVEEPETNLRRDLLLETFPNPFAFNTNIRYVVPEAGPVSLKIYDVQGSLVATLAEGIQGAGEYMLQWDATDANGRGLPSGVYFARLERGGQASSKSLLLIR